MLGTAQQGRNAGGRAALAGKLLKDLGYEKVFNMGVFKDWADSGGAVEK